MPLLPSCKDKEIAYYAHSLISLLIMFGCGQLTPIPPLTPLGMNLIGIFLGVLYGWIFIDIIWPSMAGLLALMLIGGMKPNELFQTNSSRCGSSPANASRGSPGCSPIRFSCPSCCWGH